MEQMEQTLYDKLKQLEIPYSKCVVTKKLSSSGEPKRRTITSVIQNKREKCVRKIEEYVPLGNFKAGEIIYYSKEMTHKGKPVWIDLSCIPTIKTDSSEQMMDHLTKYVEKGGIRYFKPYPYHPFE